MYREKKYMVRRSSKSLLICLVGALLLLGAEEVRCADPAPNAPGGGAKPISEEEYSEKVQELIHFLSTESDPFEYQRAGRPDPFKPFISEAVVTTEAEVPVEELTGMRKFEPGQLTLVAIVFTQKEPLAMVQDAVGKGYVLRAGMEIGRNGTIDKISDNVVVVRQRYTNAAGEKRDTFEEMLLMKEGEK